jgi:pimeloyl-ACP methyl ester carboxylesterase
VPQAALSRYVARVCARSEYIDLRGLRSHVMRWGDAGAPKLFLLHGWMDVAASFQFFVDALAREWHVIAPDLRGFGRTAWQPQGYWFHDYVADLAALVDTYAPGEAVRLAGHSLGANVAMHFAGARPARVAHLVAIDAFGMPAKSAESAPDRLAAWLEALDDPPGFTAYADFDAVAARLMKNNRRLDADKAAFLAQHWARASDDGLVRLTSDPRHKLPFPTVYRIDEVFAIWKRIQAKTLWLAAEDSPVAQRLDPPSQGDASHDRFASIRARLAIIDGARLVTIADAGHMVHHDQPRAVAEAIEAFMA